MDGQKEEKNKNYLGKVAGERIKQSKLGDPVYKVLFLCVEMAQDDCP